MKSTLPILFLLCFVGSASAASVPIRFEDVPAFVREKNQHAKGALLRKESAEAARGHLMRSFQPRILASLGSEAFKIGSQEGRTEPFGSLTAKMNLFNAGKDRMEDERIESRIQAAKQDAEGTTLEEIKKGRELYWHLVSEREISTLLAEAIEENQKNLSSALDRIRAGAATDTDRIEFEMHKLELEHDLARQRLASENTERELAVILGLAEGTRIETAKSVSHEHNDSLMTLRFDPQLHPSVRSVLFRRDEANLQVSQFSRWWYPSLDAYAGHGLHTFRERDFDPRSERIETVVGVQVTMELFDGFRSRTERSQRILESTSLEREAEQSTRELSAKIEGARAELKLTHELIHQSEDALKRAKLYLTRTLDEYRRGVKNSPDVLSALERNFAMRRRFAELRRDYQLARCNLLATLGQ